MGQYSVTPRTAQVIHFARSNGEYVATLDDGYRSCAKKVLLSLGFAFFKNYPKDIIQKLPPDSYTDTCDAVEFEQFRGKRILIVEGRQSAFE
jgi:hypothetical protein